MRKALAAAVVVACLLPAQALADTANFDLNGKIYTKFMYQNDATRGCLSLSNPFWVDNIGGHNGACTEFELQIRGRVGPRVSTGVRLQSRWGALWQGWWENGDLQPGIESTSGESLGMNHAQYIKLRGVWTRFAPPIPGVRWVTVGSTDMAMYNEWTIGKARYIDRDNAGAVTFEGDIVPRRLSYTASAIALPKLWAGPGWNTGLSYNEPLASSWGTDWAYALKLESAVTDDLRLRAIGAYLQDWEADRYDPDRTGAASAERGADHATSLSSRFRGMNATLDGTWSPAQAEFLTVSALAAFSSNEPNPEYATNLVRDGQGFSPLVYKLDEKGNPTASTGEAGKVRVDVLDPFGIGLSGKFEYFNIGSEYNANMGSRREADVLLTEGIITSGFIRGGQLPTLNVANEFVDWDEPWYETAIGWHGGTGVVEYVSGSLKLAGEYTMIDYNTDMQNRDVENQFPDFLYTSGFTDPQAFTADIDYANVFDRGKDPRSVYAEYQERFTHLAVVNAETLLPGLNTVTLSLKGKWVDHQDDRNLKNDEDDYRGTMLLGYGQLSWQATNELRLAGGYEYQTWDEKKRSGTQTAGYWDYLTKKHTMRTGLSYTWGGVIFTYVLEYFHKDQDRQEELSGLFPQVWNVWRSKATFEVGW